MISLFCFFWFGSVFAGDGIIRGHLVDTQGVGIPSETIELYHLGFKGKEKEAETKTDALGNFSFETHPGNHEVQAHQENVSASRVVEVTSISSSEVTLTLGKPRENEEMIVEVTAPKRLPTQSSSSTVTDRTEIKVLPMGEEISLPKLITSTTPGAVPGAFGQIFFRGNHSSIQYQIDGVQMPDSPSNTFSQAFSPRNIETMEVITGGVPAEYGQRLGAVINIVTQSGPEKPGGEIELNYGSYNTMTPHLLFGGSTSDGRLHYFASGNLFRTHRGIDTPQPAQMNNQLQGGSESIHNQAYGDNEFLKLDWQLSNHDKLTFTGFNSYSVFQIPNYPSRFNYKDPFFQVNFKDQFGNIGDDENNGPNITGPVFVYTPPDTNNSKAERNTYFQVVLKHAFSEKSFLQVAPYYKYSLVAVQNDPNRDLSSLQFYSLGDPRNSPDGTVDGIGPTPIDYSSPTSFSMNYYVNNVGLKSDYSWRVSDQHFIKTGFQFQGSQSSGHFTISTNPKISGYSFPLPTTGYFEGIYLQDDYSITRDLTLNAGIRYDAAQFYFADDKSMDGMLQPRVGLNWSISPYTKTHLFYGRLFNPAPVENLRAAFQLVNGSYSVGSYDIKAQKDSFYEAGLTQQLPFDQIVAVNAYYRDSVNVLDDNQLLNTPVSQAFNLAQGFAYGIEVSLRGSWLKHFSHFINYSYSISKGKGISGGIWASHPHGEGFQPLDHSQDHTANAGVTYADSHWSSTILGNYGSGLRTGQNNSVVLPSHFTMDYTLSYLFKGDLWYSQFKLALDCLNVFDNRYPITIANGYNGSHYAAGRQFFVHLIKSF